MLPSYPGEWWRGVGGGGSPSYLWFSALKVSTNEKRSGSKVVAFDRSPFKVFSLRFSRNSGAGPIL